MAGNQASAVNMENEILRINNIIESVQRQFRQLTKTKGGFPIASGQVLQVETPGELNKKALAFDY